MRQPGIPRDQNLIRERAVTRLLTVAALDGIFKGRVDQTVNYVNASLLAAERGIIVSEERLRASRDYMNLVEVRVTAEGGEEVEVSGTTIGPEPRLFLASAYGFGIDIELAPEMVFFRGRSDAFRVTFQPRGTGWVVLGFNRKLRLLENYWMADHSTGPVDVAPVLVMDMYEHAFAIDYGAAAAKYIDAFFTNIQWDAVAKRLEQGAAPMRG